MGRVFSEQHPTRSSSASYLCPYIVMSEATKIPAVSTVLTVTRRVVSLRTTAHKTGGVDGDTAL